MREGRMGETLSTKLEEAKSDARSAAVSIAQGLGVLPWADGRVTELLGAAAYPHTSTGEGLLRLAQQRPAAALLLTQIK